MRVTCPHCDSKATIRTSKAITETSREIRAICNNPECGFSFVAHYQIDYALSQSAIPKPGLMINNKSNSRFLGKIQGIIAENF